MKPKKKQEAEALMCYRLRPERRRKRAVREAAEKQLRAWGREKDELVRQQRQIPYTELDPPLQVGWHRRFELRDDVARSAKAAFYEGILAVINTQQWSHRRDFRIRRRANGKKHYLVAPQALSRLDACNFRNAELTPAQKAVFVATMEYVRGCFRLVYLFPEPWRFVLRVRPNMVYRVRKPDGELEGRLAWLKAQLDRSKKRRSLERLWGWRQRWSGEPPDAREKYAWRHWPLERIRDELKESETIKSRKARRRTT